MEMYKNCILVMIVQLYKFMKHYKTLHFNWMTFVICKLSLSKTVKDNLKIRKQEENVNNRFLY